MGKQQPFSRRDNTKKKIILWIDNIKDSKLTGAFTVKRSIDEDAFFRLDCQGVTTTTPLRFNMQVQVNYGVPDTALSMLAPATVAYALVPVEDMWSPQEIKEALKSTVTGFEIGRPGPDGNLEEEEELETVKGKAKAKAKAKKN